jgi:hypothetical protein
VGDFLQIGAQKARRFISRTHLPHPPPDQGNPLLRELPLQTNKELLKHVQRVLNSKTKLLFVAAVDPRKHAEFDYLDYLLSCDPPRAQYNKIAGTDHGFLAGGGKSKVIEHVRNWFEAEFRKPLGEQHRE